MTKRKTSKKRKKTKSKTKQWPNYKKKELNLENYINRETSLLEFNRRVLEQAIDPQVPLLERIRFLSIFHSNLDEFFMKRMWNLRRFLNWDEAGLSGEGFVQEKEFRNVKEMVLELFQAAEELYEKTLVPELKNQNIELLDWSELKEKEKEFASQIFRERIFPALTPLAVDPGHPFPFISNLSESVAVALKYPKRKEKFFARIKIPNIFPSWVDLSSLNEENKFRFVNVKDVILHSLFHLFPGMEIVDSLFFRVIRNVEVERDEQNVDNLLEMIEAELKERRFEDVVKLEHSPNPDPWLLQFILSDLEITREDLYEMKTLLNFGELNQIHGIQAPQLHYSKWIPRTPLHTNDDSVDFFNKISERDYLIHHPYESFAASVESFIYSAAEDPKVLAIKMVLYRTNEEGSIIPSLIRAAEQGKQVVCVVELKARFDEEKNINWASKLEAAGVHVVYGVVGLKTHSKLTLVVRNEVQGIKSYAHIGTGNYHSQTARFYTDLSLLTADSRLTDEVIQVFNFLTGRSLKKDYQHLLVAPLNMKVQFLSFIEREIKNHKKGGPARIVVKCNNLEDHDICKALYKASQAGVNIDLMIRGICTLKPGVKGLSENIRVLSIVDRFLEHSRIFYFANGKEVLHEGDVYIGSADWMYRNLLGRVEVITPIYDEYLKKKALKIIEILFSDQKQAWEMNSSGQYTRRTSANSQEKSAQEKLMDYVFEQKKKERGMG